MKLRNLEIKDAIHMLEWMHDENVLVGLQRKKFINKTIDDCKIFINNTKKDKYNVNLAIVDENDIYMGTVSLKNLNYIRKDAEFAITIRTCAMGKGFGVFAMKEIMKYAFNVLNLESVYWNVLSDNIRAINLYNKLGFKQISEVNEEILLEHKDLLNTNKKFLWYIVNKNEKVFD